MLRYGIHAQYAGMIRGAVSMITLALSVVDGTRLVTTGLTNPRVSTGCTISTGSDLPARRGSECRLLKTGHQTTCLMMRTTRCLLHYRCLESIEPHL